jgi:hypothetical protein
MSVAGDRSLGLSGMACRGVSRPAAQAGSFSHCRQIMSSDLQTRSPGHPMADYPAETGT